MIPANKHSREKARLEALRETRLLDSLPERAFDDIACLASVICGTPVALITLVDDERQWFKARVGMRLPETPRDVAFCAHAILQEDVLEVPDARKDERFHDNELVTTMPDPVIFYAGAPLVTDDGLPLGTVCVIDHKPRHLSDEQREALSALSRQVMAQVELRRRASEIEASELRLRYIVDHAAEVIYNADPFGRFTFVNATAEAVAGLPEAQLVGRHFTELVRADAREEVLLFYKQQLTEGTRHTYYEFPANFDGREVWFGQNVQLMFDGGRVVGFQAVARDVTEQRRIDEELKSARDAAIESARVKASFLANMSHEIRTPMNGIIGMAGLLAGTDLNADQRELTETIRTSAESLLTIINDILDFSKIEAGKLTFEEMEFDVRQALESAADLVAEQAHAKRLELITYADEQVPRLVRGDPGRLRQVLTNLLGNAVKFTTTGEVVARVSVASDDTDSSLLRFDVKDTGIGISPADQEKLFVPFVQADNSSTRRHGGTGLGLAISKQLVEMMGGEMTLKSTAGKGSTFRFTVRLTRAAPAVRRSLRDARLLVVDDNETSCKYLSRQLASWNIRAESVPSGGQALDRVFQSQKTGDPFDVVLIDAEMQGMDGVATARAIRADAANDGVKIVLLQPIGSKRGRITGIAMALSKPVKQSSLFDALATLLDDAEPAPRPPRTPTIERPISPHRIVVAEDNPVNQRVAIRQLQKLRYSADAAGNGLEAVEALSRIPYDLVLMDCQMPDMDGFSATRMIRGRQQHDGHKPVIIAMTANALEGDRDRCLAAGMDDYLSKPVRETELAAILEKWLHNSSS